MDKEKNICARRGKIVEADKHTIDYFIPKCHGRIDGIRNPIPLCKVCNRAKSSRMMSSEEYCS